jgi:hypothetical protein
MACPAPRTAGTAPTVVAHGPDYVNVQRNLALELVRVTEAAALAAGSWLGKGDKNAADQVGADEAPPGPRHTHPAPLPPQTRLAGRRLGVHAHCTALDTARQQAGWGG